MKTLYILRGISGSGKTTFAEILGGSLLNTLVIAADDYHYDSEGNYDFKLENLKSAHEWCQSEVERKMKESSHMINGESNIIVHNTNTSEKEIAPYIAMAEDYGYKVVSLIVEKRHSNSSVHNVPEKTLTKQEARLRNSIKLV